MKVAHVALLCAALGLGATAKAGFVNGGFETGDFTGWNLEYGSYTTSLSPIASPNGHQYVIGPVNDPYSPFDAPFNGNFMARLNEFSSPNGDVSSIWQTGTMGPGEADVYINWASVMEDPGHTRSEQPFFSIEVYKNGVLFAQENHNASDGLSGGWIAGGTGPNYSPIYYSSGQFHVGGLAVGDQVKVVMTSADCMQSGHVGYAYLDGLGTVAQPPGQSVPDNASTALLVASALAGMIAFRRRQ